MITPTYTAEFCVFPRATHASVSRARDNTGRKRNETIHPRRDALTRKERNETAPDRANRRPRRSLSPSPLLRDTHRHERLIERVKHGRSVRLDARKLPTDRRWEEGSTRIDRSIDRSFGSIYTLNPNMFYHLVHHHYMYQLTDKLKHGYL